MNNPKLLEIIRAYLGENPLDVGCLNWAEMEQKMADEITSLMAEGDSAKIEIDSSKTSSTPLSDIKSYLRANYSEGCSCPACGQFVKLYKRKIGAPQSRALMMLSFINAEKEWCHIREIVKEVNVHGDFAKMEHWGLIQAKPNEKDSDKKDSGLWKITEKGKQFINNEITIPSHILIYDGKCVGFSNKQINIIGSLGKKFSYNELMSRRY
jgi:predicted transcriptional regulator